MNLVIFGVMAFAVVALLVALQAVSQLDVLLLATGSEVALCVLAYEQLKAEGIKAWVVSMPSWEMFEHHCRDTRDTVRASLRRR
jgi:transketolase